MSRMVIVTITNEVWKKNALHFGCQKFLGLPNDSRYETSPHVRFLQNQMVVRIEHESFPETPEAQCLPEWTVSQVRAHFERRPQEIPLAGGAKGMRWSGKCQVLEVGEVATMYCPCGYNTWTKSALRTQRLLSLEQLHGYCKESGQFLRDLISGELKTLRYARRGNDERTPTCPTCQSQYVSYMNTDLADGAPLVVVDGKFNICCDPFHGKIKDYSPVRKMVHQYDQSGVAPCCGLKLTGPPYPESTKDLSKVTCDKKCRHGGSYDLLPGDENPKVGTDSTEPPVKATEPCEHGQDGFCFKCADAERQQNTRKG